jgi:aminopeptidase N
MTGRAATRALLVGGLALTALALVLARLERAAAGPAGTSGGPLRAAEAAYDVRRYDLALAVDPAGRRLAGRNRVTVEALSPRDRFEVDLVDRFTVRAASVDGAPAPVAHRGGRIEVSLPSPWRAGERHAVEIVYDGRPRVAPNPPWDGGFVWAKSRDGSPWVAVTVQDPGADEWWPVKDHPSDEPDEGVSIELTVPAGLVGLATGRKVSETSSGGSGGTTTTRWESSYPVNNYGLTINVGPYLPVEEVYHGVDGRANVPIVFWALPEDLDRARILWRQAPRMLEVLGRRFGEYPFLADKYAVAQSPHLGMEHQTLVGYGARFRDNAYGFDWLLMHETAHEWWGNAVTVRDWADFWIHEGFAVYTEAVFVNDTLGLEKYLEYMRRVRRGVRNRVPIIQGRDIDSVKAYHGDIYTKGACVLHTLRWLLGDEPFFALLHRFATDPRFRYRLTSSADFEQLAAEAAGRDLRWFFDRYLRQAPLPRWRLEREARGSVDHLALSWQEPSFELPLEIRTVEGWRRLEMPGGRGELDVPAGSIVQVDPRGWALAESAMP